MSAGCIPSACAFWWRLSRLVSWSCSVSACSSVRVMFLTSCLRVARVYAVWALRMLMRMESVPMRRSPRVKLRTSL